MFRKSIREFHQTVLSTLRRAAGQPERSKVMWGERNIQESHCTAEQSLYLCEKTISVDENDA